jgi:hypothetical protein
MDTLWVKFSIFSRTREILSSISSDTIWLVSNPSSCTTTIWDSASSPIFSWSCSLWKEKQMKYQRKLETRYNIFITAKRFKDENNYLRFHTFPCRSTAHASHLSWHWLNLQIQNRFELQFLGYINFSTTITLLWWSFIENFSQVSYCWQRS